MKVHELRSALQTMIDYGHAHSEVFAVIDPRMQTQLINHIRISRMATRGEVRIELHGMPSFDQNMKLLVQQLECIKDERKD